MSVYLDFIEQTITNTPGTSGNLVLGPAVAQRLALGAAQNGQVFDLFIEQPGVGIESRRNCTYTHGTTTLTRGTLSTSTTGAAINLTSAARVSVALVSAAINEFDGLIPGRVTFDRANVTVPATATFVAQVGVFSPGTDAGGARVVTLPDATIYGVGKVLTVSDESYSLRPWFRLMVAPQAGQTINGQVDGTYPMVWAGQTTDFRCTGLGWQVVACNVVPTLNVAENPNHGRGMVCVETDFAEHMTGQFFAVGRVVGLTQTLGAVAHDAAAMRSVSLACGSAAGNGARFLTIASNGGSEPLSRKSGEWAEFIVRIELPDGTNDSILEWGIVSADTSTNPLAIADPQNGIAVRVERTVSATNLVAVSSAGGTRTTVVSSVPFSGLFGFQRIGIHLGAPGQPSSVYYNDTLIGTLTTNLPAGTAQCSPMMLTRFVAGVNRNMFIDRLRYQFRVADIANRLY